MRTCSSGSTQLFGVKLRFLENPQMTSNLTEQSFTERSGPQKLKK